ncbi:MAG: FAD-dependent oxidoreductase [Candidatus Cloacimonadota bacterium]|jgi:NADPH-dependent 2,4-dienoyl-CoA reductase/sulfur reductase-like enzyme/peroxiredoxin family protein/rhodanese-related sulfurtransferase/TusA-related sulfurtransferase|nr:FAD-dependent oxidoreductase [Candidatus Cloacimonadota bacterium]NMD12715.1 FAD-dependent oxidoreductase [Candidatus Cloacimonadota bacterium]
MPKYVIVGGVAGGATTAARLRRMDEKAQIIMFEKGSYISYANCGLPYYIGDVINERDRLFVQTPESFKARLNVDVRVDSEVLAIDRKAKLVKVVNLKTGEEYSESYDKLLLSPGAEPVKPPIPGIEDEAILTLRNVPDTDRIKDYLKDHKVEKAVVVGGGFIGLEMAENLHQLGLAVTIVEMADQVMAPLDFEMAAEVHQHLKDKRVGLLLNDAVAAFKRDAGGLVVQMQSGKTLQADLVILSIGVRPDSKLAADAGLDLANNKAILVNSHLQTSDPDIYAVGDAIALPNPITKKTMSTYLAGPANKQGRIAADNMVFGNKESYCGSINTAIAKVFDLTVAATGVSEKALKQEGLPYIASIVHASSHAGYYPDALSLSVKITFEPESGRLLGGQVLGYDGVDKRIDMLAQTIKREGTVYDLMEIEHAYAPPFSSAKDPVNVAGLVADNIIKGRVRIIHWDEISALDLSQTALLDVREPEEHALGSIEGAININVDELRKRLDEVPRGKKLVLFCRTGHRSYFACRILMQNGFNEVYNLSGGYMTYKNANQQQNNENAFAGESTHKDDQLQQNDQPKSAAPSGKIIEADACGLQCPGPIMRLKQEMDKLANGDQLRITATDQGFAKDVPAWCQMTGNTMVEVRQEGRKIIATIQKGGAQEISSGAAGKNKTMIVFSDDLDRVLASFVIANGAATTGKKVTMFFTFWGLNVIKRKDSPKLKKDFMGKMFGMMLPSSSKGLGLSKINFAGLGPAMMRQRMKDKNVDSLEMMIRQAQMAGVQMIACQMSMDIMGVQAEELIDGVKIGGVATYLAEAEQANINLFI